MRSQTLSESQDSSIPLTGGPADDAALMAWRQLVATFFKLQRRVEHLVTPRGLALSQFEALVRVGKRPGMIQQELAEALYLTKGNIGALVDRLENVGYLQRRPEASDKRMNRLYLTPPGRRLVSELLGEHLKLVREMMTPLAGSQQRQLHAMLQLLEPE